MKKLRLCMYLRNSTDKGQQDYTFQREAIQTELAKRNDVTLIAEYAEKISGKYDAIADRPELQKMILSIEAGELDMVICYDVKRLSRNAYVLKAITEICKKNNVNIFFLAEHLNLLNEDLTPNAMTSMILSLLGELAEQDRHQLLEKSRDGKISAARAGQFCGGNLPTGYDYLNHGSNFKNKNIIIDESKKKVVEYIFDCIGNKLMTLNAVAKLLNNLKNIDPDFDTVMRSKNYGLKNNKWLYNSWTSSQVSSIIKCTWYALGYRVFKGEKINIGESLVFIDLDLYNRANEKMQSNQFIKTNRKHDYIMKELVFCECGDKMYPANSGVRYTYHCNKNKQHDTDENIKCEIGKSVEIERFENIIWNLVKLKLPEFSQTIEKKANKEENIKEQIQFNTNIINSINTISLPELEEQKQRAIALAIKFNTDITGQMKDIETQISEQNLTVKNLLSENTKLELSIVEINLTDEIKNQLDIIEADKTLVNYYTCKLIKKITVLGGLYRQLYNVLKIEWSDSVNSLNDTYVLYRSKQIHDTMYYYISSDDDVKIGWDNQNREITMFKNGSDAGFGIDAALFMKKLKQFYSNDSIDEQKKTMYKGYIESMDIKYTFHAGTVQELFKLN